GPGGARGDDAAEPALAGPEDDDAVAGRRRGDGRRPRQARGERIEHHRHGGGNPWIHLLHERVRAEIHVLRVPAPQIGRLGDVGIAVGAAARGAGARVEARAGRAAPAAVARAHGHAVALGHAPALARPGADLLDDAERLVAGDDGELHVLLGRGRRAFVLLVVAAADAA